MPSENTRIEFPNGIEVEYYPEEYDGDVDGIFIRDENRSRFWTTEELEIMAQSNDFEEAFLRKYRPNEIEEPEGEA